MSKMHQEALAHLVYGTTSKGCIVLLTGEIGTGKTTLSRYFLEKLPKSTDIAIITNPKLTSTELLAAICDEFEITLATATPSSKDYIDSINTFLLNAYSANRQTVLIVDEAQNLADEVLEMLRLLTNLETDRQKLLKIALLGQSELGSLLKKPELEQINQRITSRYHLQGLSREEVEAYIAHRVMVAGGGRSSFFTKGAISQISSKSRGIPRLINSLCDHALLGAYSEGKEQVDKKIVQKAATELFGKDRSLSKPHPVRRSLLATTLLAVVVICTVLVGSLYKKTKSYSPDDHAVETERYQPAVAEDMNASVTTVEESSSHPSPAPPVMAVKEESPEQVVEIFAAEPSPETVRDVPPETLPLEDQLVAEPRLGGETVITINPMEISCC